MDDNGKCCKEHVHRFFQIMQKMDSVYEEYARKNGLTYMSMYILETLYDRRECTQKEISEVTLYPKQTVNMVIKSFLEKGWVFLEQSNGDKRSKHVRLTDEGEIYARAIFEPFWGATYSAFDELDNEKRDVMLQEFALFTRLIIKNVESI